MPFAEDACSRYVSRFPPDAHAADEAYTVRDGINVARYAIKRAVQGEKDGRKIDLAEAVERVIGTEALRYLRRT